MAGAALTGGYYRTNIISGVGYSKSDSVMPLVLYMVVVAYNIRGHRFVLQIPRDSANPAEKG
jgi:hypothetical protein